MPVRYPITAKLCRMLTIAIAVPRSFPKCPIEGEWHGRATELQAIVRFRFHDGDVEEFKRLSVECMEIVRTQDTGTLQYDTYFNDDETECIVIERFRDSEALIQHGENLAHLMDAIIATGSVSAVSSSVNPARSSGRGSPVADRCSLHALGDVVAAATRAWVVPALGAVVGRCWRPSLPLGVIR